MSVQWDYRPDANFHIFCLLNASSMLNVRVDCLCIFCTLHVETVGGPAWQYFSAVCWYYGIQLYEELGYPIGLVSTTWGGTPDEAWSSPDALAVCADNETAKILDPGRLVLNKLLWFCSNFETFPSKLLTFHAVVVTLPLWRSLIKSKKLKIKIY